MSPPETAGNGPSGDDLPRGGSRDGSAAEIAARARAEAFEECARIAEQCASSHGPTRPAILRDQAVSKREEGIRIAAEIRRRIKP